jgi:hypothetical protein
MDSSLSMLPHHGLQKLSSGAPHPGHAAGFQFLQCNRESASETSVYFLHNDFSLMFLIT